MSSNQRKYLIPVMLLALILGSLGIKGAFLKQEPSEEESSQIATLTSFSAIPWDMKEYSEEAALIVIGEVTEVADRQSGVGADAKLNISHVIKGDAQLETVNVYLYNNSQALTTFGSEAEELSEGEKVLVFLGLDSEGKYVVFAGENGKFLIDENQNIRNINVKKTPLSEFEAQIKTTLQR